ncbi:MAG: efflux RND transporter permease subunit, partial [Chloroflexaceae bacterium]|nr:efflux RND transporter permease subunit [Chloroflexaceae bacterium]
IPGVLKVNILGVAAATSPASTAALPLEATHFSTLARFNGREALVLEVIKQETANTLEVAGAVAQKINQIAASLPQIQLSLSQTQADYIREATQSTLDALILAVILAVVVILVFLRNWRATLVAALAIPISLMVAFLVMAIAGLNLETITLLAIALVVGIIVDDAIVEVENVARHVEAGKSPKEAAIVATNEIGLTVTASTLTIAAVFVPVAFMQGTVGQFFKPFGLTVSVAVLASLLVARTLSPVLSIYCFPVKSTPSRGESQIFAFSLAEAWVMERYRQLLAWALNHRTWVVSLALLSLVVGVGLIPLVPNGFIPKLDRGEFNLFYTTELPRLSLASPAPTATPPAPNTSEDDTFAWLDDIAQSPTRLLLRRTARLGESLESEVRRSPEVASVLSVAGLNGAPNKGKLYIKLRSDRAATTAQVQEQLRSTLASLPGVTTSIEDIPFVEAGGEKNLQLALVGDDLTRLQQTAQTLQSRLADLPAFVDVTTSLAKDSLSKIDRRNGDRVVYVSANVRSDWALGEASDRASQAAQALLPAGITLKLGGDSAYSRSVITGFTTTFALAVVCLLGVLIAQFGRLLEPLVIGLCLPLALVGSMVALLVTGSAFGVISLIGLLFLLGLLDKNAILLLDYANQLRQNGKSRREALMETGVVRLRPIVMTTASTIFGMLPLALGWGAGAELRQPMAVVIIGGLLTSSLLSLIVVPVVYTLLEDGWQWFASRRLKR